MKDFADLEALHKHLEDKAVDYKYSRQIINLFQELRDLKRKESNADEAEQALDNIIPIDKTRVTPRILDFIFTIDYREHTYDLILSA